jgi:hypothetical protein
VTLSAFALLSLAALLVFVAVKLNDKSKFLEARRRWLDAREADLDARERVLSVRERAADLTTTALVWRTHLQASAQKEIA